MNGPRDRNAATALAFLVGVILSCAALAQEAAPAEEADRPSPAEARAAERRESLSPELRTVLDNLDEANAKVKDVTARLVYERAIPLLDEKQKSKGSLVLKKPDRIIIKLGKPRREDVYTNGKLWWVVSHEDEQVEIYRAAEEGEGSQEAVFLEIGYGSTSNRLLEQYEVELAGKEVDDGQTRYRLRFTPRPDATRPARYDAVEIELSDETWLPDVILLSESGGEILHTYTIQKPRLNQDVEDDVFDYEPPGGYTVLRPEDF